MMALIRSSLLPGSLFHATSPQQTASQQAAWASMCPPPCDRNIIVPLEWIISQLRSTRTAFSP